jgi:hypothetical protein
VNRLTLAFAGFIGLGILAWFTLSDQRIRLATLAVLAMFALRTWARSKHDERTAGEDDSPK